MSAVEHVKLVHQKYPTMWAGCGEVRTRPLCGCRSASCIAVVVLRVWLRVWLCVWLRVWLRVCSTAPSTLSFLRLFAHLQLFFRHDDLTNLAMGRDQEIPRPDHPAMYRIYEYCQENGLIIQAHHNLYKSGSSEMMADWLAQLTNVLQDWPDLTFLLCHCGISRLCWDQVSSSW